MLTDLQIRGTKPRDRSYRVADGGGLYLEVRPTGRKCWRLRYTRGGSQTIITLGEYPEMGAAAARAARDAAQEAKTAGRDPLLELRTGRLTGAVNRAPTLREFVATWHEQQKHIWRPHHAADVLSSLEAHALPDLGNMEVHAVTAQDVLRVLRKLEQRPAIETAHRVRQRLHAVYKYAIICKLAEHNPAAAVQGMLAPIRNKNRPAALNIVAARQVLRNAECCPSHPSVKLAMRFLALTGVRPGEVRGARWDEMQGLDTAEPIWDIPPERMKMQRGHLVPLSRQAVEVLQAARPLAPGMMVFPSPSSVHRPISDPTLSKLLRTAGHAGQHVPHGWRATLSTTLNERDRSDRDVIELILAHVKEDKIEAAYNRALHIERRRELLQWWADELLAEALPLAVMVGGARR